MKSFFVRWLMPRNGGTSSRVYFWTSVAGCLYAGSSFVMLMVTTNYLGGVAGGVLALALTLSQQLYALAAFCMRPFQVSDMSERYSFSDYAVSRIVTCLLCILIGVAWIFLGGFSTDKKIAVCWLLVVRCSEAFSDVLGGRYQQKGRFDVSGRVLALKSFLATLAFVLVLLATRSVLQALAAMALTHVTLVFLTDFSLLPTFGGLRLRFDGCQLVRLLTACLPLAVNSYLLVYLNNGPKFAIDKILDEKSLAIYTSLSMVSFVIALLSDFIVSPQIVPLSVAYHENRLADFSRSLGRQVAVILALGLAGIAAAWFIGTQVLSVVFGLDLIPYRVELCVLLGGGICLALYQVCQLVLIVLRKQLLGIIGMGIAGAIVWLGARPMVIAHGIRGASYCFLVAMASLFFVVLALAVISLLWRGREDAS